MRDLHSHYLPGVDDGSNNIDTTKSMLELAYLNGITDIVFTPHYIPDSKYLSNKKNNLAIFEPIKKYAKEKYDMNLFLGNEVYFNDHMYELLESGEISTLNDSRYMLIEIPLYTKTNNVKSIFYDLITKGIKPILAHPERYTAYYKDFDFFYELKKIGVLFQINYPSVAGLYGRQAKKMAKEFLKRGWVDFVGSDMHKPSTERYEAIPKVEKKIKKIVGDAAFIDITNNNFARVVRNEEI